jgi:hypothetical protein
MHQGFAYQFIYWLAIMFMCMIMFNLLIGIISKEMENILET